MYDEPQAGGLIDIHHPVIILTIMVLILFIISLLPGYLKLGGLIFFAIGIIYVALRLW